MGVEDRVGFILKMGRAMHGYGYAAHRLEEALSATAKRLGLEAQFFSTPTSIFAAFGPQEAQRTHLIRVEPGETDLGRLADVDRIALLVIRGALSAAEGSRALDRLFQAPPAYGPVLTTAAYGFASAAAARFLSGGIIEIVVAGVIGIVTGLLALLAARSTTLARIFEPAAAFVAAVIAGSAATLVTPFSVFVAVLAGLIVLIPGLMLTVAMTELSTRHLVSGTARLSSALLLFVTILFGVALGGKLVQVLFGATPAAAAAGLPVWTEFAALAVAPFAFAILLRAHGRDIPWIIGVGGLAYGGARLGAAVLGAELGAFVGAFTVGVVSNVYALVRDRPAQILHVPGVLLLVPGTIGFRSVSAMLERQVVSGIETAFTMIFIATALVAGLLVANVVVPRRKSE
jgi:uncharacterized membrane protein YjjP (DUF1212 family)